MIKIINISLDRIKQIAKCAEENKYSRPETRFFMLDDETVLNILTEEELKNG